MANRIDMPLDSGDDFPQLTLDLVGGGQISLPGDWAGSYGLLVIYRGSWCGFCRRQLTEFQEALPKLAEEGIKLAAACTQREERGQELIDKLGITFPMGYRLDALQISSMTGSFYHEGEVYLHAAGFLLTPEGKLDTACFSTGAIGRMAPGDVIPWVRHLKKEKG